MELVPWANIVHSQHCRPGPCLKTIAILDDSWPYFHLTLTTRHGRCHISNAHLGISRDTTLVANSTWWHLSLHGQINQGQGPLSLPKRLTWTSAGTLPSSLIPLGGISALMGKSIKGRDLLSLPKRLTWTSAGTLPSSLIPLGGISALMGKSIQWSVIICQDSTECSEHFSPVPGAMLQIMLQETFWLVGIRIV